MDMLGSQMEKKKEQVIRRIARTVPAGRHP
jgi:hypothetical protein